MWNMRGGNMSVNTAKTLNSIFSNTSWKLLLVIGLLAFIACFFIKGKKRAIPIVVCILSLCLYLVTAVISGTKNHLISQQAGQEPEKISDMDEQEPDENFQVVESENENEVSEDIPESKDDTIAVMMSVSNVTSTGLTVHFRQYDKRENLEQLVYTDNYNLETLNGDTWEYVPMIIELRGNEEDGFINMPAEGESELEINWKRMYGELAPGTYRITMIMWEDEENPSACAPVYRLKSQFIITEP
jgi:hypothetical protein